MSKQKNDNLEEALSEFEKTVIKLSDKEVSLEEATKLYELGLKQCELCEKILNEKKQKIEVYGE